MLRRSVYTTVLLLTGRRVQLSQQRALRDSQFLDRQAVSRLADARLARVLTHAYAKVPYYREQWQRQGMALTDVQAMPGTALAALPLLSKDTLRACFDTLRSDDLHTRKWYFNTSGGSTGEPVRFVQDQASLAAGLAGKALFDAWTGYHYGMRKLLLWGSERDLLVGRETWRTRLGRWARNELAVNTFRMSEADMQALVRRINRFRPVQILAYAESADELARFVESEGLALSPPRAVITSAGTLWPPMRERIQRVFGAPVFNRYGSREVGDIACECALHQGLHVPPMSYRVEIIADDGRSAAPGQTGEVVVTSLINFAMPLIRYRIGDSAAWSPTPCGCGRQWPLLASISGRVTDAFLTRNGARVHGGYFTRMLYGRDWIRRFQFIQEDVDHIALRIVPAVPRETAQQHLIREKPVLDQRTRLVMGGHCRLRIELVDDIPSTASGKHRYVISRIARAQHEP